MDCYGTMEYMNTPPLNKSTSKKCFVFGVCCTLITVFMLSSFATTHPLSGKSYLKKRRYGKHRQVEARILYMNNTEAYARLERSLKDKTLNDHNLYFKLSIGFEAQIDLYRCSAATIATILNSFKYDSAAHVTLPLDPIYESYRYATQNDVFQNECTRQFVNHPVYDANGGADDNHDTDRHNFDGIASVPYGLGLSQVSSVLRCHFPSSEGWNVRSILFDPQMKYTVDDMRAELIVALMNSESRAIVNFSRSDMGQSGGGHFSPVAAYDSSSDSFLILDVSKYEYPPSWVSALSLYKGISTVDDCGSYNIEAQSELPVQLRNASPNSTEWGEALEMLGCVASYRGMIIVDKAIFV